MTNCFPLFHQNKVSIDATISYFKKGMSCSNTTPWNSVRLMRSLEGNLYLTVVMVYYFLPKFEGISLQHFEMTRICWLDGFLLTKILIYKIKANSIIWCLSLKYTISIELWKEGDAPYIHFLKQQFQWIKKIGRNFNYARHLVWKLISSNF